MITLPHDFTSPTFFTVVTELSNNRSSTAQMTGDLKGNASVLLARRLRRQGAKVAVYARVRWVDSNEHCRARVWPDFEVMG